MSDERLECRLKKDIKIILQKAADIMGITLGEFVVNAACSRAYELVRDHTIINAHMENMENIAQSLIAERERYL